MCLHTTLYNLVNSFNRIKEVARESILNSVPIQRFWQHKLVIWEENLKLTLFFEVEIKKDKEKGIKSKNTKPTKGVRI